MGEHSDLVVIWGGNPVNTQVNVMTHVTRAQRRGATLVVVDPYRTGTAERADVHLALRPGTDGALACAVMHVLFAEGYADWPYMRRYTDAPDELAAHLRTRTPAWAAEITGLTSSRSWTFARLYGRTKRSFIRCHHGFSRSRNGAAQHARGLLPPRGDGRVAAPGRRARSTARRAIYPLDRSLIEGLDRVDRTIRALDQSRLGPILTGDPEALQGGPPVTAMLVQNTNPAMVCPELHLVHRGLAREDLFLCVHEQFLTETAAYADVVLPATMFLEHDDFYTASGHTYFQVARKVIEPPGECRENHFVICELARRLGAEHPGFGMTAWEIMDQTLQRSGMWDARTNVERGGQDMALPFEEAHFLQGFKWPDGKFRFKPDWDGVRRPGVEDAQAAGPLRRDRPGHGREALPAGGGARRARSSTRPSRETPGSLARERRPTALMNPDDCVALGVAEGDRVTLGNERGAVVAHARSARGPAARRGRGRGNLAEQALRGRHRHQRADERRARVPERRRRVPRHGGLGPAGVGRGECPPPLTATHRSQPTSLFGRAAA